MMEIVLKLCYNTLKKIELKQYKVSEDVKHAVHCPLRLSNRRNPIGS